MARSEKKSAQQKRLEKALKHKTKDVLANAEAYQRRIKIRNDNKKEK